MSVPTDPKNVTSFVLQSMINRDVKHRVLHREQIQQQKSLLETELHSVLNKEGSNIKDCIHLYRNIVDTIKVSKSSVKNLREKILQCKKAVSLNYPELRTLFHNSIMHNETIDLMDKIENMLSVSIKVDGLVSKMEFKQASILLKKALDDYNEILHDIPSLESTKMDIDNKFAKFFDLLNEELSKYLYEYVDVKKEINVKFATVQRIDDYELHLRNIIESYIYIDKLPMALSLLSSNLYSSLDKIVARVIDDLSQHLEDVLEYASTKLDSSSVDGTLLTLLISNVLALFLAVSENTFLMLSTVSQLGSKVFGSFSSESDDFDGKSKSCITTENFNLLWQQFYHRLQSLLDTYLLDRAQEGTKIEKNYAQNVSDCFKRLFVPKKRITARYHDRLFAFDFTNANSILEKFYSSRNPFTSYTETSQNEASSKFFCSNDSQMSVSLMINPDFHYISKVYLMIFEFMANHRGVEKEGSSSNMLLNYLHDFVNSVYLPGIMDEIFPKLNSCEGDKEKMFASGPLNYWRISRKDTSIVQSAQYLFDEIVHFLKQCVLIPDFSQKFLEMVSKRISFYYEACQRAIDEIFCRTSKEKDLNAGDKSSVTVVAKKLLPMFSNNAKYNKYIFSICQEDYNREIIDDYTQKMYEMFIAECNQPLNKATDIIERGYDIRSIIQLIETLDWLTEVCEEVIRFITNILLNSHSSNDVCNLPLKLSVSPIARKMMAKQNIENNSGVIEGLIGKMVSLKKDLLLVLHLDLRVRTCVYVYPLLKDVNYYNFEHDVSIESYTYNLEKELGEFADSCVSLLNEKHMKFIFAGYQAFLSKIFISATRIIKRINKNGVSKIVQNMLSLKRELAASSLFSGLFHHALSYYELFNNTPEEILANIKENGLVYTRDEYANILALRAFYTGKADDKDMNIKLLDDVVNSLG